MVFFFLTLERKARSFVSARKPVMMSGFRQKHLALLCWPGSRGAALARGGLVSAGEGPGRAVCGRNLPCPVKACSYFLLQPGAALSSKWVSGMLEAGV